MYVRAYLFFFFFYFYFEIIQSNKNTLMSQNIPPDNTKLLDGFSNDLERCQIARITRISTRECHVIECLPVEKLFFRYLIVLSFSSV